MKNLKHYVMMLFASLLLTMCQKKDVSPGDLPSVSTNEHTQFTVGETCGAPTTCKLYAGRTIESGTVTVSNDNTNLYVKYSTTGTFDVLHLWVGTDLALVPSTKPSKNNPGGVPVPGQFPYKFDAMGASEHLFIIPLANISFYDGKCGTGSAPIYVVAHAENNTLNNGAQTAFGGCTSVNITDPGRWYYYMSHTVQCCETPAPPPTSEKLGTAFAKGNYVFTTDAKSNPEKLPTLSLTKNRWGWAVELPVTSIGGTYGLWAGAGLNKTVSGIKVGTVSISYNGSQATVTYNLANGYSIEEAHVYADGMRPLTIAPGQYGNTYYFDPKVSTFTDTYSVTDSDGDGKIWFIIHAVAYGTGITNS